HTKALCDIILREAENIILMSGSREPFISGRCVAISTFVVKSVQNCPLEKVLVVAFSNATVNSAANKSLGA
ncbi:MAG: hypothetical protein ABJZ69_08815, partial [Hyphomicrobiales bacterium]